MYVGIHFAGDSFIDVTCNVQDEVVINDDGFGEFKVKGKSTSIWVRK